MKDSTHRSTIRHDAACWIARLHAEDCTEPEKQAFRSWLSMDPDHAAEFQHLTGLWELGGGVPPALIPAPPAARKHAAGLSRRHMLACLGAGGLMFSPLGRHAQAARVQQTGPGELATITLGGQARCLLDTDTRLVFLPDSQCCRLEKGQMVLSTAGSISPVWLFAGSINLRLRLHASADIRIDSDCVHVTAVRDRVLVHDGASTHQGRWLQPGQRLRFFKDGQLHDDYPDLDALLSWQEGRLVFRNRPLWEVIAEINRYMPRKITLAAPLVADRRLSGVYYIARGDSFLQMLVHLFPVRLVNGADGLTIAPV